LLSNGCSLGKRSDYLRSCKGTISQLRQQAADIVVLGNIKLQIGKDAGATGDIERDEVIFARL
jgi:hypothetical protein